MSFKSRAGATPGNVPKTNQDAFIINNNFCGFKNKSFYAVCDGHGTNGHLVSGFVKNNLSSKEKIKILFFLSNLWIRLIFYYFYKENIENYIREQKNSDSPNNIKMAINEGYFNTHRQLLESKIECSFSGTTTVSVLIINKKLYCANVGDSRAIMCASKKGEWTVKALSEDQKPDTPLEKARILEAGGRVEPYTGWKII